MFFSLLMLKTVPSWSLEALQEAKAEFIRDLSHSNFLLISNLSTDSLITLTCSILGLFFLFSQFTNYIIYVIYIYIPKLS